MINLISENRYENVEAIVWCCSSFEPEVGNKRQCLAAARFGSSFNRAADEAHLKLSDPLLNPAIRAWAQLLKQLDLDLNDPSYLLLSRSRNPDDFRPSFSKQHWIG
ncbi:hypothetical protein F2P81_007791 [Scophthalmus maximus]|uniref:Uncharacterized protein n=1 Tax=Scophthalmus maximus TaxID=52904 RepID=A0A6A4SWC6_SCOMX|nr:hypothetical protein F2P81_007791 [Scophthalmus maximus]